MTFPQGINFIANEEYRSGEEATDFNDQNFGAGYPEVSPQGNNVGWESSAEEAEQAHDDGSGIDVRLAGNHYDDAATVIEYRIDLSGTGDWDVSAAFGDHEFGTLTEAWFFDTTTERHHCFGGQMDISQHDVADSVGDEYSEANWPGSETITTITMTSTIFRLRMDSTDFWGVEHIRVGLNVPSSTRDQDKFRVYDEDGVALAAEDATPEIEITTPFVPVANTQYSGDPSAEAPTWYHRKVGDADTELEKLVE